MLQVKTIARVLWTQNRKKRGATRTRRWGLSQPVALVPGGADLRMLRGQPSPYDTCGHQLHFGSKVTVAPMVLVIF